MDDTEDDDDPTIEQSLATLRDYLERSTHWREGGADRHAALKEALPAVEDHIEWIDRGLAEWRAAAIAAADEARRVRAVNKIAIGHLHAVLNTARTHAEQQAADTAARDWLTSIGSEPS